MSVVELGKALRIALSHPAQGRLISLAVFGNPCPRPRPLDDGPQQHPHTFYGARGGKDGVDSKCLSAKSLGKVIVRRYHQQHPAAVFGPELAMVAPGIRVVKIARSNLAPTRVKAA